MDSHRFSIICALFVGLLPLTSSGGSVLVTDIDDTIRRTNVEDVGYTVYHGLAGAPAFAGMATLYDAMVPPSDLVALSGAPKSVLGNKRAARVVKKFLRDYGFRPYSVVLKNSLFESTSEHKKNALLNLAVERSENFILIGDDTEHDPEVYDAFRKKHPDRVTEIYIRVVTNRHIPRGIKKFNSALDIAESEFMAGRLSKPRYLAVGIDLLESDEESFAPEYAWCRREYKISGALKDPAMRGIRLAVNRRMFRICERRWNNPNWRRFYERKPTQFD